MKLIDGLSHDQVGQEARHRLLGATPWIAGEVVERIENGSRDGWGDGNGERARARIRCGRVAERPLILPRARIDHARAGCALLNAERKNRQRHLECVRFFIRERLGSESRVADHSRLHSPIHVAFGIGGDSNLLRLAAEHVHSTNIESERSRLWLSQGSCAR